MGCQDYSRLHRLIGDLKGIRDRYVEIVEDEAAGRIRFNQAELAALNDDISLVLGDDTRINNSFINESQQKPTTGYGGTGNHSNTPSKAPAKQARRSDNKHRQDDSMIGMGNSQLGTSMDRPLTPDRPTTPTAKDESMFIKSVDFNRMLKRRPAKNYSKVLIPFIVGGEDDEDQTQQAGKLDAAHDGQADATGSIRKILDLYSIGRKLREEASIEYFEGVCLIRSQRRPVLIKQSTSQFRIIKEITAQLALYESEVDFHDAGILKMRDFFCYRGAYFVVYDRPADSLASFRGDYQRLTEDQMLRMTADIARAIQAVHQAGMVNCKLNSDSVCMKSAQDQDSPRMVLCDFERAFFEASPQSKLEADCCSAPEVVLGLGPHVDRRADYWSLGCLIFFMATGKHLLPTTSKASLLFLVVAAD